MRVSHAHEMAPRINFKLNRGRPKKEAMCTRPFPRQDMQVHALATACEKGLNSAFENRCVVW